MAWCRPGAKPLSEPMLTHTLMHICDTRRRWVNTLRPGDALMRRQTNHHWFSSDNGLSPGRRQAIIWTSAGILLIGPLGTNFSEIPIGIQTFSVKKIYLKMSSAKWRPFCLGLNVLRSTFSWCPQLNATRSWWWWVNNDLVMACCGSATSHYLSQCWPRCMSPWVVTRWVKHY